MTKNKPAESYGALLRSKSRDANALIEGAIAEAEQSIELTLTLLDLEQKAFAAAAPIVRDFDALTTWTDGKIAQTGQSGLVSELVAMIGTPNAELAQELSRLNLVLPHDPQDHADLSQTESRQALVSPMTAFVEAWSGYKQAIRDATIHYRHNIEIMAFMDAAEAGYRFGVGGRRTTLKRYLARDEIALDFLRSMRDAHQPLSQAEQLDPLFVARVDATVLLAERKGGRMAAREMAHQLSRLMSYRDRLKSTSRFRDFLDGALSKRVTAKG